MYGGIFVIFDNDIILMKQIVKKSEDNKFSNNFPYELFNNPG